VSLIWNILTTLSARLLTLTLALISSIILARMLGPEGRGVFALVLLLPELARSFALLGFEQANAVYAGLEPEHRRTLVWHSAALAGGVGGLTTIAGMGWVALGAPGFEALVRGPLWLYLLALAMVPGRMVVEYWWAILRGMNRIALLNMVEVGTKVASLSLVIVFVGGLHLGIAGAVWANSTVSIASVLLMVALLTSMGVLGRPSFERAVWKRTGQFALPAYCTSLMGYLNYRIDQFIIAAMLPPEQLGFYVIAVDLAERLWILTGAVANVLLPHLTNSPGRDPTIAAVVARHVTAWTGAACLLVFGFTGVIVQVLYSSAYAEVVAPLRWLLPGICILSTGKVLVAEVLAQEKVRSLAWVSVIGTMVNIAGNLWLIPQMGISGAALASSISYSLISFTLIVYYLRLTDVPWTMLVPHRSDLLAYTRLWRRPTSAMAVGHNKLRDAPL
jgi:O-antigen/teichoic acid export membrane protein